MRPTVYTALAVFFMLSACQPDKSYRTWQVTGGSKENIRYSALSDIDTTNVSQLVPAWVYSSGDKDSVNHSQIQCNPIMVDGVLYATTPQLKLVALDAATGAERWRFDPRADQQMKNAFLRFILNNNRGVTYWQDGNDRRIFLPVGSFLYAIDAATGKPIPTFGTDGFVDLHEGLGRDVKDLYVAATSPGVIFKDLLIMGARVSEGSDAAPGHIRAFDVRTGKQQWIFHTIPHPGEFGYDTWEDSAAYKHIGGANAWSGFSLDEKRGLVFVPVGSASFDFYGGMRKGANLFANSILALDAATGAYRWHFQTIHHDVWDRDLPTPPSLVTVNVNGKSVDAVAQPTKHGYVFLLDRETGKPLYPVEEAPAPTVSDLEGEVLWPTQPRPTFPKPFMRQGFTEAELNNVVADFSAKELRRRFDQHEKGELFTPLSRKGTIIFPGLDGGAEWGGSAFDPATGYFYVNANEVPWVITMTETPAAVKGTETNLQAGERLYRLRCMACHGPDRKGAGNFPTLFGVEKKYTPTTFADLLKTGRRMMPAQAELTPEEVTAIASFVLDRRQDQPKKFEGKSMEADPYRNLPYTITGYSKFETMDGFPGSRPPWGTLNAIDLNSGEIAWKITLGQHPAFADRTPATGTENYGGPVVTSSGLVFIAATMDEKIRAFHKKTGKLLWEAKLPASAFATPAVYEVNGKTYIVVACGGGKLGTKSGDSYVAFSLPNK